MTGLTRSVVENGRLADVDNAATDLNDVRETFLDSVAAAHSAPERADSSWAGAAAEACRDRLSEEVESARRVALEFEEVADTVRSAARRLGSARSTSLATVADIEADPHGLIVHEEWQVNASVVAFVPTESNDPESVRRAMAGRQEQLDGVVEFLVSEDREVARELSGAVATAAESGRRLDHAAAFEHATGRLPETTNDWLTGQCLIRPQM